MAGRARSPAVNGSGGLWVADDQYRTGGVVQHLLGA
jgi:hypothetical protein